MSVKKVITNEENFSAVKNMLNIMETSIGPNGRLKVLQTKAGGYAMTTTTSSKLFDFMTPSNSVAQILLSAFTSHVHLFKDGGLLLASLACRLYLFHTESELSRQLAIKVNDFVLGKIQSYINKDDASCKIDIAKLNEMILPVKTILSSKPAAQLSFEEINHLSIIILKAFFKNINMEGRCSNGNGMVIVPCEGPSVAESHLILGIVLPISFVDAAREKLLTSFEGPQKIAVFTTSLSGDQSVITDELLFSDNNDILDEMTMRELFRLADLVISLGVNIVCCQKVVYPSIRKYLEKMGVFVVERLGFSPIHELCKVAHLEPVESLFVDIEASNIGIVASAEFTKFNCNRYLILHPYKENEAYTMMLCAYDENSLNELKVTIQAVEKTLFHILKEPKVFCGGGCFEIKIASYVRYLGEKDLSEEMISQYDVLSHISSAQLKIALNNIARSFESIAKSLQKDNGDAYIDATFNHLWCFPRNTEPESITNLLCSCCCGSFQFKQGMKLYSLMGHNDFSGTTFSLIDTETATEMGGYSFCFPEVADSLLLKRECISTAFELCNVILRIGVTIE